MTEPSTELLERARQYEPQALSEIYDRYAGPVYRYLYRTLGDPAVAEDLTGEVFVKLLQQLRAARLSLERMEGWLYRVAHNLAMDWFRAQRKRPAVPLDEGVVSGDKSPAQLVEQRDLHQQLRNALRRLTADQQQVILLRFGEELKVAEVARLMGKSEGAVKVLQHRAVQRVRRLLGEE